MNSPSPSSVSNNLERSSGSLSQVENRLQVGTELQQELLSLSFQAFQAVVRRLLRRMGYTHVRGLGRRYKRGRTASGGSDLGAAVEAGITRTDLLLQIKQYRRPVSRRFVDELRGTCLRLGAEQGILVTTSTFCRPALKAAILLSSTPIRLIDGSELIHLLIKHGIGIRPRADGSISLDTSYFEELRRRYPETSQNSVRTGLLASNGEPVPDKSQAAASTAQPAEWGQGGSDMTWRTHAAFAVALTWLLTSLLPDVPIPTIFLAGFLASLGALMPDLDTPESHLSRLSLGPVQPLQPLSRLLYRLWGHRGPLHSWIGLSLLAMLSLLLWPVVGIVPALALLLGYGTHLLLDSCTRTGIPLLYPRRKRYFLLPRALRLTTGSQAEEVLLVLLLLLILDLLLRRLSQS